MNFINNNTQKCSDLTIKIKCITSIFILFFISSSMASDAIDLIRPTGKWYTAAHSEWADSDACGSYASSRKFEYENLSPSFEEAKETLFNQNYRGGECTETISDRPYIPDIPEDWPIYSYSEWDKYQKQHPSSPRPKTIHYKCINNIVPNDGYPYDDSYTIFFDLQPQYQCVDGSCNGFKKACPGDVYAGDLLQWPVELIGHTGIIWLGELEGLPEYSNMVMEVTNKPPIIHFDKTLQQIEEKRPIWGVRYGYGKLGRSGEMSFMDSSKMISLASVQSLYCPQYTLSPIYHAGGQDKTIITNPVSNTTRAINTSDCAVFRCDTFVQYIYKEALDTYLPPNNELQMPKDLFDAFPNQRGETHQLTPVKNTKALTQPIQPREDSRSLWDFYKQHSNSLSQKLTDLDGIAELNSISYVELIDAISNEQRDELKTKLLYLTNKKIKSKEKMGKGEWIHLNSLLENFLNKSHDAMIIVNTLMLDRLMLSDSELIHAVDNLVLRLSDGFLSQDLIMINNSINLLLFELILDNENGPVHNDMLKTLGDRDLNNTLQSFSMLINDCPEKIMLPVKKRLHDYLLKAGANLFHDPNDYKNRFHAKSWSSALIKVRDRKISPDDELYLALKKINDRVVTALIILENKEHISTRIQKNKLMALLKQDISLKSGSNFKETELRKIKEAIEFLDGKTVK